MSPTQLHIGAAAAPAAEVRKALKKGIAFGAKKPGGLTAKLNDLLANLTPIKNQDLVTFFRLLATMINAGISIVKALHILTDQVENPHFKKIVQDLAFRIETGSSFSEALSKHDKYFNESQMGMVEAGEASGQLNDTLLQIAAETEKSAGLASKVKGAMIYPVVVIFIMIGAIIAVMTLVMPQIKEMFEGLGAKLPAMTQILIKSSDFMVAKTSGIPNVAIVIAVFVGLILAFTAWKKTHSGRYLWDQAILYMPVVGSLMRKMSLAKFCRSLSTLTGSGVSIIKALRITAASASNEVYKKRINQIADDVKQGITMAENMQDDKAHFPSMVVGMINVAEQTAQIDTMTGRLADFYEDEVDTMVKNLSSLMEPLIIVILGATVGFLVLAVMMPILESSDLASQSGD
jgi:type IV pilus assembly protein PilC